MARRTNGAPRDQGATGVTVLEHVQAILREKDLRDQQRYDAQTKAVEAAFLAQQTAMQAAMLAASTAVQAALSAAEKAVSKAEVAAEKRFEGLNELRKVVEAVGSLQMPRAEAEQRLRQLAEKVDELKTTTSTSAGRSAGLSAGWVVLVGAIGMIAVLSSHVKFH